MVVILCIYVEQILFASDRTCTVCTSTLTYFPTLLRFMDNGLSTITNPLRPPVFVKPDILLLGRTESKNRPCLSKCILLAYMQVGRFSLFPLSHDTVIRRWKMMVLLRRLDGQRGKPHPPPHPWLDGARPTHTVISNLTKSQSSPIQSSPIQSNPVQLISSKLRMECHCTHSGERQNKTTKKGGGMTAPTPFPIVHSPNPLLTRAK